MEANFNIETKVTENVEQALLRVALALASGDVRDIGLAHPNMLRRLPLRQLLALNLAIDRMHEIGLDEQFVGVP